MSQHSIRERRRRLSAWLGSPSVRGEILQIVKASLAAAIAWVIAELVLHLEQAVLAPWVALLTMHATVYRTVWRGAQTVLAVGVGVLLSLVVVQTMGVTPLSFGLAMLIALALARIRLLRDEGITIATTALFVMTTGYDFSDTYAIALIPARLLDTAIGVAVALVINVVIVPPLHDKGAKNQIDEVGERLGGLLVDMAVAMRSSDHSAQQSAEDSGGPPQHGSEREHDEWIQRTRDIDESMQLAWSWTRTARESGSFNPRRRRVRGSSVEGDADALMRMEDAAAQTRSIARHLRDSSTPEAHWEGSFRERFSEVLELAGRSMADSRGRVVDLREALEELSRELPTGDMPPRVWPLYGALITELWAIVDVIGDIDASRHGDAEATASGEG